MNVIFCCLSTTVFFYLINNRLFITIIMDIHTNNYFISQYIKNIRDLNNNDN